MLRVFNKISSHDAVSWNAILGRYAMQGPGMEALKHFEQMCEEGVQPNDITFVCLLLAVQVWWMKACAIVFQ